MTAWVTRSAGVADNGRVAEPEPEDDRRVDPMVEAGDDEHLRNGQAERSGGVGSGGPLVAFEQGGHPGHGGSAPFKGVRVIGWRWPGCRHRGGRGVLVGGEVA